MPHNICIVGCGISGLSSAYVVAKQYRGCSITIIHNEKSPDTTSDHGFGMLTLQVVGGQYENKNCVPWAIETFSHFKNISATNPALAEEMGINKVKGFRFVDNKNVLGEYKDKMRIWDSKYIQKHCAIDFRKCSDNEMIEFRNRHKMFDLVFERPGVGAQDIDAYTYKSFILDTGKYLSWLRNKLKQMQDRGHISSLRYKKKKLVSFKELRGEYDLVVNCSGLGSSYLANDKNVIPIRGQYVVLDKCVTPDQDTFYYGMHTFTCPKPGRTNLGSIFQIGRIDREIDRKDTEDLIKRNSVYCPAVKDSKILDVFSAIRPSRVGGARVEIDWLPPSLDMKETPVIHNYGHGAKGIMLHWGSALEVLRLSKLVLPPQSLL